MQNQELGERYPPSATGVAIAFKDGFAGKELRVLIRIASFPVTVSSAADSSVKAAADDQRRSHAECRTTSKRGSRAPAPLSPGSIRKARAGL